MALTLRVEVAITHALAPALEELAKQYVDRVGPSPNTAGRILQQLEAQGQLQATHFRRIIDIMAKLNLDMTKVNEAIERDSTLTNGLVSLVEQLVQSAKDAAEQSGAATAAEFQEILDNVAAQFSANSDKAAAALLANTPQQGGGDTGSGDTGSGDTGSGATGSGDTGSGDTGSGDTGGDTGAGDNPNPNAGARFDTGLKGR